MGWQYAIGWLITLPFEITAAGITIGKSLLSHRTSGNQAQAFACRAVLVVERPSSNIAQIIGTIITLVFGSLSS